MRDANDLNSHQQGSSTRQEKVNNFKSKHFSTFKLAKGDEIEQRDDIISYRPPFLLLF
jgi:hypothetical protein